MEFAYVSMTTGKPTKHDEQLMSLFRDVLIDVSYQPDSFNRRMEELKQQQQAADRRRSPTHNLR